MNDDTCLIRACFLKDPDTGEVLTVEKDAEYLRLLNLWHHEECKHPKTAPFRVKIANGGFQVRACCIECGDRLGTALSQKDKEWVSALDWQPEEHAATYKSRRDTEWQTTLLDLARRQYAERGRFTKSYSAYIRSEEWKAKRALVLKRCSGSCEGCGVTKATEVHHSTYHHLFNEFLFELVGLCHACHERLTLERRGNLGLLEEVVFEDELVDQPF